MSIVSCVSVACVSSDSTVLILTGPLVGRRGNCSVYGRITECSVLQNDQTSTGAFPATYSVGTGGCPGVQQPGRESDHSFPCSTE